MVVKSEDSVLVDTQATAAFHLPSQSALSQPHGPWREANLSPLEPEQTDVKSKATRRFVGGHGSSIYTETNQFTVKILLAMNSRHSVLRLVLFSAGSQ